MGRQPNPWPHAITPKIRDRFWSRVDKSPGQGPQGTCWLWQRSFQTSGYGQTCVNNTKCLAHRVAWWLTHGEMPEKGMLHKCDTPACVNPDHLFPGTALDNSRDCVAKGRSARGSSHGTSKLLEAEAVEIRRQAGLGVKRKILAKMFRVHRETIGYVTRGKGWRHLA
jgi:hypothetical protein